jgi:hypothetical protein
MREATQKFAAAYVRDPFHPGRKQVQMAKIMMGNLMSDDEGYHRFVSTSLQKSPREEDVIPR